MKQQAHPIKTTDHGHPVYLCTPDEQAGAAQWDEDTAGFWECDVDEGPVYVVIGWRVTDEKCRQLAERHQLDPEELIRFRDTHVPAHASGLSG